MFLYHIEVTSKGRFQQTLYHLQSNQEDKKRKKKPLSIFEIEGIQWREVITK